MTAGRRVLGLGCGAPGGSAEIVLKAAMRAAAAEGADVELVRLDELRIPSGPDPAEPDDAWWYWERLVQCDGLIRADIDRRATELAAYDPHIGPGA